MDSNNGDDFRGFDDNEDDDDEHEYLERNTEWEQPPTAQREGY